jgi:hypothetical protein
MVLKTPAAAAAAAAASAMVLCCAAAAAAAVGLCQMEAQLQQRAQGWLLLHWQPLTRHHLLGLLLLCSDYC